MAREERKRAKQAKARPAKTGAKRGMPIVRSDGLTFKRACGAMGGSFLSLDVGCKAKELACADRLAPTAPRCAWSVIIARG